MTVIRRSRLVHIMATSTNMTGELTADGSVIFLKASEKEARNVLEAFTDGRAGRSEGGDSSRTVRRR